MGRRWRWCLAPRSVRRSRRDDAQRWQEHLGLVALDHCFHEVGQASSWSMRPSGVLAVVSPMTRSAYLEPVVAGSAVVARPGRDAGNFNPERREQRVHGGQDRRGVAAHPRAASRSSSRLAEKAASGSVARAPNEMSPGAGWRPRPRSDAKKWPYDLSYRLVRVMLGWAHHR